MASTSHGDSFLTSSQLIENTTTAIPTPAESASQPFPDIFRHRASDDRGRRKANKRPITLSQPILEALDIPTMQTSDQGLKRQVFSEVAARLEDVGVRIEDMDPLLFSFLLPGPTAVVQDWNDLLNFPIFVSPEKLRTMLSLTPADEMPRAEGPTTVFYVRTFTFYLEEFLYLIQLFIEEYGQYLPEQVKTWNDCLKRLSNDEDPDTPIYLRYIGVTTQKAGAAVRLYQDLTAKKTQGFNGDFLRMCRNQFPVVIASAQVDVFDKATIDMPLRHSQTRIVDTREQALIAEFGHSTLLNSSIGGNDAVVELFEQDNKEFSSFGTQTISRMEWQTSPAANIERLQSYGRTLQRYARVNADTTNYTVYPIDDEVRDLVVDQSVPAVCDGHAIMVTIGSDLGPESHESKTPFFHGGVRSSALAIRVVESMVHSELGYSTTTSHRVPALQSQGFLPFVDLYPWARRDDQDLPTALQLLRRYLHIANPIIVLTFSELVSGVCIGSCHHRNGLRRNQSVSKVAGQLFMSKYDHDPLDDEDDHCFIVIPCVHPGSLRYANDNKPLGRIFAKTLAVAWLAMDIALDILKTPGQNKRKICEAVIERVEARTGSETDFGKTFQKVREDYAKATDTLFRKRYEPTDLKFQRILERTDKLANSRGEQNLLAVADFAHTNSRFQVQLTAGTPQLPAAVMRCKSALEQVYRITDCDIARGNSTSDDRKAQVKRLTGLYASVLNGNDLSDGEFAKALSKVKAGEYYYFAMTSLDDQTLDLSHLLSFFVADDVDVYDANWISDEDTVKVAIANLKDFMSKQLGATSKLQRLEIQAKVSDAFQKLLREKSKTLLEAIQQLRRFEPFETKTYRTSPHKVLIKYIRDKNCGLMEFQWEHAGTLVKMIDFYIPMAAAPILPREERFIVFNKQGIDIQDAQGRSLATTFHVPVTIPIEQLVTRIAGHPMQAEFVKLWEKEAGMTIDDAIDGGPRQKVIAGSRTETAYAYPKSFFHGQGRGLPLTVSARTEDAKAEWIRANWFPFKPVDVGWIIHKFLEDKYPNGGDIDLCSPEAYPNDRSAWTELRAFLDDPLYTHHPHRYGLIAACASVKNTGLLAATGTEGYRVIRAMSRLVRALRPSTTERVEAQGHGAVRRSKFVLSVPSSSSVPAKAIMATFTPKLEEIKTFVEVSNVDTGEIVPEDEDNDDVQMVEDSQGAAGSTGLSTEIIAKQLNKPPVLAPTPSTGNMPKQLSGKPPVLAPTLSPGKRAREVSGPVPHKGKMVYRKFGDVKQKYHIDALIMWGNRFGWNPKQVSDDDDVLIEIDEEDHEADDVEAGMSRKKPRRSEDPEDDEMLLS